MRKILTLFIALVFSFNIFGQIFYDTENEFSLQSSGWQNFGQRSGDVTTLNMHTQDFEDYEVGSYAPIDCGVITLAVCSGLYLITKRKLKK